MSTTPGNLGGQFDTLYHLTSKRNFKLNPKQVPADNALAIRSRDRPGLYAASSVEPWWNGHGYHRPYVAELQVPKGVAEDERWSGEKFIPGEHLQQAQVSRVMPVDAWVREKYSAPGWVESHHGTAFDTGEKVRDTPSQGQPATSYPDYKYGGPDVRDFTPEQHAEHTKRLRSYKRAQDG